MDTNINLYKILGISSSSSQSDVKSSYKKLAKIYHPDVNKTDDENIFKEIIEAYKILSDKELREEYDKKSRFGNNYNEYYELFDVNFDNSYENTKDKYETFKKNEVFNIHILVNDKFDGKLEYERWVLCKTCDGSGKDLSSKIVIKDNDGKVLKIFDSDDGCDFCFEENNYVVTDRGPVRINDVEIGDMVLSESDRYHEVTHLLRRDYSGELYDIEVSGIKVNGVTPNHKFNIVRFKYNNQGRIKIDDYELLEISADELTNNDFILYQKQSYNTNKSVVIPKARNKIQKLNEILIDDDFIKFMACYITEGNTSGRRVVVLTFHIDKDRELIDFIKEYAFKLNLNLVCFTNKSWGDKAFKIEIFNTQLAKFVEKFCGYTSLNKYVNNDLLGKNDQLLLDTLLLCDGHNKNNFRTYTTVSKKLAYQVLHISLGLGHNASISCYDSYIDKNGINHKSCYRVYITYSHNSKKMGIYNKKIKEGVCLKIKKINKRYVVSTKVYNLTIKDIHKYTIDGLLVNNCEGTGKGFNNTDCSFCSGQGKIGINPCKSCKGDKRILGKQKLTGIKLTGDETKIDAMGHYSKDEYGKVGYLLLIKEEKKDVN